jgi:hypothetical protein
VFRVKNETTGLYFAAGSYGGRFSKTGKVYVRRWNAEAAVRELNDSLRRLRTHAAAHGGYSRGDVLVIEPVTVTPS